MMPGSANFKIKIQRKLNSKSKTSQHQCYLVIKYNLNFIEFIYLFYHSKLFIIANIFNRLMMHMLELRILNQEKLRRPTIQ